MQSSPRAPFMPYDPNNPDDRNPNWVRPKDFREDWPDYDSVNWKKMVAEMDARTRHDREAYGFVECPMCHTLHTAKTLVCRECNFKVQPVHEVVASIAQQ